MSAPPDGLMMVLYIFLSFWLALALAAALQPRLLWRVVQGWQSAQEPPALHFHLMRIGGVLVSILVVWYLFF